jgi:uncharacterized protein (DUF2132 family)
MALEVTKADPSKGSQMREQHRDIMRGVKLKTILHHLVDKYGWEQMGQRIDIKCFQIRPTFKSSLMFIRRNQWAIDEVEMMYIDSVLEDQLDSAEPKVAEESSEKIPEETTDESPKESQEEIPKKSSDESREEAK